MKTDFHYTMRKLTNTGRALHKFEIVFNSKKRSIWSNLFWSSTSTWPLLLLTYLLIKSFRQYFCGCINLFAAKCLFQLPIFWTSNTKKFYDIKLLYQFKPANLISKLSRCSGGFENFFANSLFAVPSNKIEIVWSKQLTKKMSRVSCDVLLALHVAWKFDGVLSG